MRALVVFTILYCCISGQRIRYISTEHLAVTYFNPKYLNYVKLTSQRYGRGNPFYYVGLHYDVKISMDNKVQAEVVFYEFLTNQYKRSFVEMHFGWCDLVLKNDFFGKPMRQGKLNQSCPFPPGEYHLYNMSIPLEQIPRTFPFKKGRIGANLTIATGPKGSDVDPFARGYIDMEVREYNKKTKNSMK